MQRLRHHPLARARFADDQDARVAIEDGMRHLLAQLDHGLTDPDDALVLYALGELRDTAHPRE